jgi:hypothetical protein
VVAGTILETIFTEDARGERYHRHSYHGVDDGKPDLRLAGSARLRRVLEIERTPGTVYSRSRSDLHTAAPSAPGLVVSLVLQRPHDPEPADVFCVEPVQRDPIPPLSVTELRELLEAVVEAIR